MPNIAEYAAFIPFICKILALLVSQEGEPARADQDTVGVLLSLASRDSAKEEAEDFIALAGVAAAYLADEGFQTSMIERNQVKLLLDAFHQAQAGFSTTDIDDEDTAAQLKQLRVTLLTCIADVSGNDKFAQKNSLSGEVAQLFVAWLQVENPSLQSAACLALGNLSRSDEASLSLVQSLKAHAPLIRALQDSNVTDSQFLHASLSFLKNLVIPAQNKHLLEGLLHAQGLPRIYSLDTLPQIQFAAISLTRLLLVNCPSNARIACLPSDLDASTPTERGQTIVGDIVSLFGRSDAEPTKLEAARCIASICRMLHSATVAEILSPGPAAGLKDLAIADQGNSQTEAKRSEFYAAHPVEDCLKFLVTQDKWPSLRSEAWFVFALMSRSPDGARLILRVLEVQAAGDALREAITGNKPVTKEEVASEPLQLEGASQPPQEMTSASSSLQLEPQQVDPKQKESMGRVDRENVLILCTELNKGNALDSAKRSWLQTLIQDGTRKLAMDREHGH